MNRTQDKYRNHLDENKLKNLLEKITKLVSKMGNLYIKFAAHKYFSKFMFNFSSFQYRIFMSIKDKNNTCTLKCFHFVKTLYCNYVQSNLVDLFI